MGVSLKNIGQEQEEKKQEVQEIKQVLNDRFSSDQLIQAWSDYAATIELDHHFKNSMLNCIPELLTATKFEVVVSNAVQEQKILGESVAILNFLKEKLRNTNIKMDVRISESNEKKLAFTSVERFDIMAEENENLLYLKQLLDLELS